MNSSLSRVQAQIYLLLLACLGHHDSQKQFENSKERFQYEAVVQRNRVEVDHKAPTARDVSFALVGDEVVGWVLAALSVLPTAKPLLHLQSSSQVVSVGLLGLFLFGLLDMALAEEQVCSAQPQLPARVAPSPESRLQRVELRDHGGLE